MKVSRIAVALAATFAVTAVAPAAAQQLKLMTGPQGGAWYPLGGAIQNIIEKNIPGTSVQVLPGAGISNVVGVQSGKAELGFGNAVSSVDGINGVEPFKAKQDNVCHIGTLYFQYFHAVAFADSGVKTLADAKGKALTTQQRGNTGEQMTRDALQVHGLDYKALSRVNFGNYTDSVSQLKDGHAQVFTLITTVPASSIMDLASAREVRVLDFPDDKFRALQKINRGYDKRIIRAGSYPKQDRDIQTIGTWTHLVASCKLPEQLVYNITKSLASNVENLGNVVAAVKGLTVKDMASDVGLPFHPGARRFYQEAKAL
jgi:uncharacterized protein